MKKTHFTVTSSVHDKLGITTLGTLKFNKTIEAPFSDTLESINSDDGFDIARIILNTFPKLAFDEGAKAEAFGEAEPEGIEYIITNAHVGTTEYNRVAITYDDASDTINLQAIMPVCDEAYTVITQIKIEAA